MALLKQPWLGCPVVHYRSDAQCHPWWSNAKVDHCGKIQSARCRDVSNGRSRKNIGSSRISSLSNLVARCMEDSVSESSQEHSWETNGRPRSGIFGDSELTPHDRGHSIDSNSKLSKDIEEGDKSSFRFEGVNNQVSSSTSKNSNNLQSKTTAKGPEGAKDALPDNTEWKNVFPTYMQSRQDDSDGDNDEIVQVTPYKGNGQAGRVNGVVAAKAAAAATASAKAFELHVNARNLPSTPALATPPCSSARPPAEGGKNLNDLISHDPIWAAIRAEARLEAEREPLLSSFLYASILAHPCFERSLGFVLANRLTSATLLATQLMDVFDDVFLNDQFIRQAIRLDVQAIKDRDPSCLSYSSALLYLKGYHALQSYRVAHNLWNKGSTVLALALQARISEVFAVDIHPAARIGKAILLDHGTGVVIGETAVVGDRVSMLQGVTLGGTGKAAGDRHPKIREGVLLGAGATILGNIVVGRGAMVAAGSLVLKDVPAHSMVAGTPAKVVGFLEESTPSLTMKHDVAQDFCQELEEAVRRQVGDHLWGGAGI